MTITWYPPSAGTGQFLSNPPFAMNIKTARSAKQATETTGLRVDRLDAEAVLGMGRAPTGYIVNLEARL